MIVKYTITPDEVEYLIRMLLALLEEKKQHELR